MLLSLETEESLLVYDACSPAHVSSILASNNMLLVLLRVTLVVALPTSLDLVKLIN